MSEIFSQMNKLINTNWDSTLKYFQNEYIDAEQKARCVYFISNEVEKMASNKYLATVVKEIFIDLTNAIFLSVQSHYRTAFLSLRSSLELTLVSVYFADHPIEFAKWRGDTKDFQFSNTLLEVLNKDYVEIINPPVEPKIKEVQSLYRDLSQYVHGKFSYLSVNTEKVSQFDKEQVKTFLEQFEKTVNIIVSFFRFRFNDEVLIASKNYSFLRNMIGG